MKIEETYNIHKKINCIFPFFKSKAMCKNGVHNFRLNPQYKIIPHYCQEQDYERNIVVSKIEEYERVDLTNLKCFCCGREEKLDD